MAQEMLLKGGQFMFSLQFKRLEHGGIQCKILATD